MSRKMKDPQRAFPSLLKLPDHIALFTPPALFIGWVLDKRLPQGILIQGGSKFQEEKKSIFQLLLFAASPRHSELHMGKFIQLIILFVFTLT